MTGAHTYTVRGTHPFPIDMLRYDASYPSSESESAQIHNCAMYPREEFSIVLSHTCTNHRARNGCWTPTTGRWRSFGWNVTKLDGAVLN